MDSEGAAAQKQWQKYDPREHVQKKGMWAGLTSRCVIDDLVGAFPVPDGAGGQILAAQKIGREHTPALLKCFDEYLVNSSDHAVACATKASQRKFAKVTYITVQFEPTQGIFDIVNDGPGIPVVVHDEISKHEGHPVYIPEIAFCHMFSGTNLEKEADNIKGGTNGVGAKIGNIHSKWFSVSTVAYDADGSKRAYTQTCQDQMRVINPPAVVDLDHQAGELPTPHTRVRMLPVYDAFGYQPTSDSWSDDYMEILGWLRLRCCQLAAYVGDKVQVTLNGEVISTVSAVSLSHVYFRSHMMALPPGARENPPTVAVFETQIKPKELPHKKYPWNVVVIVSTAIKKFTHVTVLNGVVSTAGPHVDHLRKQFKEAVLKKLQTATKDKNYTATIADVCKHMLLVVVGPLSGADWSGQRKDEVAIKKETLTCYQFPVGWCRDVSACLAAAMLEAVGLKKSKVKRNDHLTGSGKPKGYVGATRAGTGTNKGKKRKLMFSEGDSASTLLRAGLTLGPKKNPGGPTFEDYGIFCLYGVPMNASNFVTKLKSPDGREILVRKKNLENNVIIKSMLRVLGLSWDKQYQTEADMKSLRYDGVIICVDGDVDGAGKIAGIVLMNFFMFWPALIARGFIQWFMTPVIRVYPRAANTTKARAAAGPLKEFYLEQGFHAWMAGEGRDAGGVARYYKGLGSHDDAEIPEMFRNFEERLFTFILDEHAPTNYEIYFGDDAGIYKGKRKEELSTPQEELTDELMAYLISTRTVPCTIHLKYFVKPFKLEATERQLPGAFDSLNVVRRKALAGARMRFGSRKGAECQTFQLAGYVADKMLYHHAATSMENAIQRMCQDYPGARNMPLLQGIGAFGTWTQGGKDAASPRYTKVALNVALSEALFPVEDDWLLPYAFTDGVRAEPKSYIPVICATAIDNHKSPSEGWAYCSWGRNPSQVIEITRAYCDPKHPGHAVTQAAAMREGRPDSADIYVYFQKAFPLTVSLRGLEPNLRMAQDCIQHIGRYELHVAAGDPEGMQGATVIVYSLPCRTWSKDLCDKLQPKETKVEPKTKTIPKSSYIEDGVDHSGEDAIRIIFKLKPGALAAIKTKYGKKGLDPIEDFFELHTRFTSILNPIRPAQSGYGGVIHFGSDYHAMVLYHLPARQKYYLLRFERRRMLLKLEIRLERETLRYIGIAEELGISKIDDLSAAAALLSEHGFPRVDHVRIRRPGYLTLEELALLIVDVGDASGQSTVEQGDADEGEPEEDQEETKAIPTRPSHNYILNLRVRDRIGTAQKKRHVKLGKLEATLKTVEVILAEEPFPAASVWRAELNELERVLQVQNLYT
jgi:DNA topoisomerase-2